MILIKPIILYIEDDQKILNAVITFLEKNGFVALGATSGQKGIELLTKHKIDLLLLDLSLKDMQGENICELVVTNYRIPIIMITAKVDEDQVVRGFKLGASDYIKKPFGLKELNARINVLLNKKNHLVTVLSFNNHDLVINIDEVSLSVRKKATKITKNEFKILSLLANNPNKVFNREQLIMGAFGYAYDGFERTIDSYIKNLRAKIEIDTKKPMFIETVHSVGYRFIGVLDNE